MSPTCFQVDDPRFPTITGTMPADSSCGNTVRVRYCTNQDSEITVRYSVNTQYKEIKENIKKYLERKKVAKIKSGWKAPKREDVVFDTKPRQSMFKNFAMNSNRGN